MVTTKGATLRSKKDGEKIISIPATEWLHLALAFLNGWRLRKGKKKRRREGGGENGGVKMRSKWAKKIGIKAVEGSDVLRIGYPTVLSKEQFPAARKGARGLPLRISPFLALSFVPYKFMRSHALHPTSRVLNHTFGARSRASLKHPASSPFFPPPLSPLLFNFDRCSFLNEFVV